MRHQYKKWGALLVCLPIVGFASVSAFARTATLPLPNDPYFKMYRGFYDLVGATGAYQAMPCQNVTIAILDSGVNPVADLKASLVPGWNFIDNNADTSDTTGHGTQVASAAAAIANNGIGTTGVCGGAKIMPLKIADQTGGHLDLAVSAINWAVAHGARVINFSYGGPGDFWQPFIDAINAATAQGAVIVMGAGNTGSADQSANPLAAAATSAIRVAGVDITGQLNVFSNRAQGCPSNPSTCWVDIAGSYIFPIQDSQGQTGTGGGTSIATAEATGAAAYLLSYNPGLSPAQVKSLLMQSCKPVAGDEGSIGCGGVLDVYGSLVAAGYKPVATTTEQTTTTTTTNTTKWVTVHLRVSGRGSIKANGAAVPPVCHGLVCKTVLAAGVKLQVTALPAKGWRLAGWSGACHGLSSRCITSLKSAGQLNAKFVKKK